MLVSGRVYLVGGFNPSEKYARQIGNLPKMGGENKKYLKPSSRYVLFSGVYFIKFQLLVTSVTQKSPRLSDRETVGPSRDRICACFAAVVMM